MNASTTKTGYRIEYDQDMQWSVFKGTERKSSYYATEDEARSAMRICLGGVATRAADEMLEVLKFVQDRLRGDHECYQRVSNVIAKAEGYDP